MKRNILIALFYFSFALSARGVELESCEKEVFLDTFSKISQIIRTCYVIRTAKSELVTIGSKPLVSMSFERDGPFTQDEIRTFLLHTVREIQTSFAEKQGLQSFLQGEDIDSKNMHLSLKIIPPKWIHTFFLPVERSLFLSNYGKVELFNGQIKYYSRSKLPFLRKLIDVETVEQAYEDLSGSKWVLSERKRVPPCPKENRLLVQAVLGKTAFEVRKKYGIEFTAYTIGGPKVVDFIHPHFQLNKKIVEEEARFLVLGCLSILMDEVRLYDEIQPKLAKHFSENNIEVQLISYPGGRDASHPELHKVHLKGGEFKYYSLTQPLRLNLLKKESLQEAMSLVNK